MKLAASYAIASLAEKDELGEEYILPLPLDKRIGKVKRKFNTDTIIKKGIFENNGRKQDTRRGR